MKGRNKSVKNVKTRKEDAKVRQEQRDKRTPQDQLKRLDEMLGVGVGAQKERTRLKAVIEHSNKPKQAEEAVAEEEKKFKVKKGEDPIKEKKKFKREMKVKKEEVK